MKNFQEFTNEGYYDPPEDSLTLFEEHDVEIQKIEDRMVKEGLKFDPEKFYDSLTKLKLYDDFEKDLTDNYCTWYNELYWEKGDEYPTPEYSRVKKEAEDKWKALHPESKFYGRNRQKLLPKNKSVESYLFNYLIEKNWDKWKALYQKWIDVVHQFRGKLHGMNYGL